MKRLEGDSILVVDNDRAVLRDLDVILRMHGAEVDTSCTGNDAIASTKRNNYDAVLTDLCMSGGDGYSLVGSIHPCKRSRVVIMTGDPVLLSNGEGATAFGVRFVLPKPFSVDAVTRAVCLAVAAGKCGCEGCTFKEACPVKGEVANPYAATILPSGFIEIGVVETGVQV